jgi:hypothetical protein
METKIGILEISSNEQHFFLPLPIKVRRIFNASNAHLSSYPSEISDCSLANVPSPHTSKCFK